MSARRLIASTLLVASLCAVSLAAVPGLERARLVAALRARQERPVRVLSEVGWDATLRELTLTPERLRVQIRVARHEDVAELLGRLKALPPLRKVLLEKAQLVDGAAVAATLAADLAPVVVDRGRTFSDDGAFWPEASLVFFFADLQTAAKRAGVELLSVVDDGKPAESCPAFERRR